MAISVRKKSKKNTKKRQSKKRQSKMSKKRLSKMSKKRLSRKRLSKKKHKRSRKIRSFGKNSKNTKKNKKGRKHKESNITKDISALMAMAGLGFLGKKGYDYYNYKTSKLPEISKLPETLKSTEIPEFENSNDFKTPPLSLETQIRKSPNLSGSQHLLDTPNSQNQWPLTDFFNNSDPYLDSESDSDIFSSIYALFSSDNNIDGNVYIEVMPDVEGCWTKVVEFMSKSDIFTIDDEAPTAENLTPEMFNDINYNLLKMKGNTKFICLGDTIDNGPNNIAILKLLKYLKTKYKDNVIFILGNRDLNKLRLIYEINRNYPRINIETDSTDERLHVVPYDYPSQNKIQRLKWLFENTMGATNTFNYIKQELKLEDDDKVVDEYMELLDKNNGLLRYYLDNGKLVHYDKKTKSLFIHGGINCDNFKKWYSSIYNTKDKGYELKNVTMWVEHMNLIMNNLKKKIEEFEKAYNWKAQLQNKKNIKEHQLRQFEKEVEYFFRYFDEQDPIKSRRSVIISRPWKKNQDPNIAIGTDIIEDGCFDEIAKEVNFIFNGHTPIGQLPLIMRSEHGNKEIIFVFCDTTYSGRVANIKLIGNENGKYQVLVKAKYVEDQSYKDPCSYTGGGIDIKYSTKDPIIGTDFGTDEHVIAKIKDKYLTVKLKYNQKYISVENYNKREISVD